MKLALTVASVVAAVAAVPDPLVTPRAELAARQDTDPALLGWIDATNGQCWFPTALHVHPQQP